MSLKTTHFRHFRAFAILLIIFLTACSSQKTIVHNLDERDANDILVFLDNKGITAIKVKNTDAGQGGGDAVSLWDIQVSPEDASNAMALLNAAGLPRRQGQNLLNIFSKGGLVPSEMEEKIRYQAGLAEQIASVIRKIDGVVDADVQLSFPEENLLNPNAPKDNVTASVFVKHTGVLDDPNTQLITKIRRLVQSSVQGLKFDNVTVIPVRTRYSEFSAGQTLSQARQEHELVNVWSMVVAKDSVRKFQIIFFGFLFFLLLLLLSLSWFVWKMHLFLPPWNPKQYLDIHPFYPEGTAPPKPVEEKKEGEEGAGEVKKEGEEDGQGKVT